MQQRCPLAGICSRTVLGKQTALVLLPIYSVIAFRRQHGKEGLLGVVMVQATDAKIYAAIILERLPVRKGPCIRTIKYVELLRLF